MGLLRRIALLIALLALPAPAAADTVKHVGSIVVEVVPREPSGCSATAYWQWSELAGAKSYNLVIKDSLTTTYNLTWPPYTSDGKSEAGGPPVAKGSHRHGLSGISGPNCDYGGFLAPSRWEIKRFTATFDDKTRIVGTATDAAGAPVRGVRISITGKSKASATTNQAGAYTARVKKGKHTVTAPEGYCLRGVKSARAASRSTSTAPRRSTSRA